MNALYSILIGWTILSGFAAMILEDAEAWPTADLTFGQFFLFCFVMGPLGWIAFVFAMICFCFMTLWNLLGKKS